MTRIESRLNFGTVHDMAPEALERLLETERVFLEHAAQNETKERYYEGKISLDSVNLGIALPEGMRGLEIGCAWGAKCVDVLAARSRFDGFVGVNGGTLERLDAIVQGNNLVDSYAKACRDELKLGAAFCTLSHDPRVGCKIRFHSARTAAALWDGDAGRISCGFAVIDYAREGGQWVPALVYFYDEFAIWALRRESSGVWRATMHRHLMGRPLMEPLCWNATQRKPFGRSRIKEPIRRLIDGYVRTMANASIGLEFATAPQKYLLGLTDEQFAAVVANKQQQYAGNLLAATDNPDTGNRPEFGQLAQGNIEPHIAMLRALATQFAAATGLSVVDTGVVNDANPTSSDAIEAQTKTLVGLAEQLNASNGEALRTIALMAQAIDAGTSLDELTDEQRDVVAHFKNPSMPSVAAMADAAVKISNSRPSFAGTDVFLEMMGFSPADVRRIKQQESLSRGLSVLQELEPDEDVETPVETEETV